MPDIDYVMGHIDYNMQYTHNAMLCIDYLRMHSWLDRALRMV